MNLKELSKVRDSKQDCLISFCEENSISKEDLLKELNAYLDNDTKVDFIEHFKKMYNIEDENS